jgi:hypothetical protein
LAPELAIEKGSMIELFEWGHFSELGMGDAGPREPYVYIYFNDDMVPYYFDPETGDRSYTVAPGTRILDPETRKRWRDRKRSQTHRVEATAIETHDSPPPGALAPAPDGGSVLNIADAVHNSTPAVNCSPTAIEQSVSASDLAPYIPNDLKVDISQFQFPQYVQQFFRDHRKHFFPRKQISLEALTHFTDAPLQDPLLCALDAKTEKLAFLCFRWILIYTGVENQRNPAAYAERLVNALRETPILRDEVMFQLMKQTCGNPNPDWLLRTWELFLIVVTCFPSTKNSEIWIKSHFSHHIRDPVQDIAELAQFCYIRFAARCAVGKPLDGVSAGFIQSIPVQFKIGHCVFGASIYEQLWNQRRSVRKLPIPYMLHHMAGLLLVKGAEQTEGIFRLPGNLRRVNEMADEANKGRDAVSAAPMNDIASLFKKWVRDLPDPIVNMDSIDRLRIASEDKSYSNFVETLPRAHHLTLMYLVGFLQRMVRAEAVTMMTAKNLSIVFAPNIVQLNDSYTNETIIQMFATIGREFMEFLIVNWDTSPIYPLSPELLSED